MGIIVEAGQQSFILAFILIHLHLIVLNFTENTEKYVCESSAKTDQDQASAQGHKEQDRWSKRYGEKTWGASNTSVVHMRDHRFSKYTLIAISHLQEKHTLNANFARFCPQIYP